MTREADCAATFRMGADELELGLLTGFTRRAAESLVHLREAWLVADPGNRAGVAIAIAALLHSPSLARRRDAYLAFVFFTLEPEQRVRLLNDLAMVHRRSGGAL